MIVTPAQERTLDVLIEDWLTAIKHYGSKSAYAQRCYTAAHNYYRWLTLRGVL